MSTDRRCRAHVLWITLLQLLVFFTHPGPRCAMAIAHFTPYVSEFEYASRFHPSRNPDCPTSGWTDNSGRSFGSRRYRRSPEEGAPVGQEPSIEVRAILVRCPKSAEETDDVLINRNVYNITAGRSQDILDFHGFDRDEPAHHSEVRDCRRKLIVTMKFNNIGRTKTQEEFVVIDHVLDPVTMHKARLLNPFVVKVRQEPVLQLYGLKFQGVVNAEAREEVVNKKLSNYTGCDDASDNPTCGQMIFDGKPIPYSQGFCCSCDPDLNTQRQASLLNETVAPSLSSFFSKNKDRPIRPFKSPRSVNTNFPDSFPESDEPEEFASSNREAREDIFPSNYESLINSNNAKFVHDFESKMDENSTIYGPYDDEQALINLKQMNKMEKGNRGHENNENTIASQANFSPSIFSTSNNEKHETFVDATQNNFDTNQRSDVKSELRYSNKKDSSYYKPTTDHRDSSSYQKLRNAHLAAELTKLEEDFKHFRMTSMMRAKERNNEAKYEMPVFTSIGNVSSQRSNDDHLIGHRNWKESTTKINNDYQLQHNLLPPEKMPPLKGSSNDRGSTLSIEIKLAIRPKEKSSNIPLNSVLLSSNTCSTFKTLLPVTFTTSPSLSETATPSVLRQKVVSDRVHPSTGSSNVVLPDFHFATEKTSDLRQKINNSDVADLLANAVMSENDENASNTSRTSAAEPVTLEEMYNATSSENSITGSSASSTETSESLQEDTDLPETRLDIAPNRVESPSDSSTSFSSGNISKYDAIALSGSLKNQLANWLPQDKRNKSAFASATTEAKLKEHVGEESEVGYNGEVEVVDATTVQIAVDNPAEKHIRHEDRSTTSVVRDRRPVEVHLSANEEYPSPPSKSEHMKSAQKKSQRDDKALRRVFIDYPSLELMDFDANRKSSLRSNVLRSHRSVTEDDSVFVKDNDRQRSIDKRIEDEFEEISGALKEAADSPKVIREKAKSESIFEQDNSVARKFASMFERNRKAKPGNRLTIHNRFAALDANPEVQTEISKHTESFAEPVSEIMLTTEHQIIVDRFRLVNDFQQIPATREKPASSHLTVTNESLKMRDRKHEEFPTTQYSGSAKLLKNEVYSDPAFERFQKTDHRVIEDRFEPVRNFKEITNEKRLHEESLSTPPSLAEVSPAIRGPENEKESATSVPSNSISIAKVEDAAAINQDSAWRRALLPVLTIENLKKELRKEAVRYSSITLARSTAISSDFKEFRRHGEPVDEVREVNTDLTPAERVEDLITDEETLPPDEETKHTTDALSKTTHFQSEIGRTLSTESSTVFPRFAIQSFDAKFINTSNRALPEKRANKILILLEEPSSLSLPARTSRLRNKRIYKKRIHRHRNRRNNRHKKRSIKAKRNTGGDATESQIIVKGRSENEDDEHPWYDTTTKLAATNAKGYSSGATSTLIATSPFANNSRKNRKRRFYVETSLDSGTNSSENDQLGTRSSNEKKLQSPVGRFYASITRIPESEFQANVAGLRIEEIPKKSQGESSWNSNFDEAKFSSPRWTEQPGEVDEMPIFRDSKNFSIKATSEGNEISEASASSEKNLQTLSQGKFLKSKRSVDATMGNEEEDGGRNNKRNDLMDSYESEKGDALVFYDYEDSEARSAADSGNEDNNSSPESFVPKEHLNPGSNKNDLRNMVENNEMSESGVVSTWRNNRLNSRSDAEIIHKNSDLVRKNIATELSSSSLNVKKRNRDNRSGNKLGVEPSEGWKEKMELLKLKKHADVLKEYLNWRQDVASLESLGIPGYTTRISLTNGKEEQTGDFLTTDNVRVADETTLPSTVSTSSVVTEELPTSVEQRTDIAKSTTSGEERYVTNLTGTTSSFETSAIFQNNITSGSCSDDSITTTVKLETSGSCSDNKTEENFRDHDETSTGRILPPCGYKNSGIFTCHTENRNTTPSTFSKSSIDVTRDHQKELSDLDKDLIIISVIEKNRRNNKNQFAAKKLGKTLSKIHRTHDDAASAPIFRHHRRRHKSKNKKNLPIRKSDKIRYNRRRSGRQLMALEDSEDRKEDYEDYDLTLDNIGKDRYVDLADEEDAAESFNGDEHDSEIWNKKWNQMIDKIIHENTSQSWKSGNASRFQLKESPGDSQSAMQQLHFNNADKYIRQIAKNIVHNTNIHERKQEKGNVREDSSSRRRRPVTRRRVLRRKLQSYPIARGKVVRKAENSQEFVNYEEDHKRSSSGVGSRMEASSNDRRDSSGRRSRPAPRSASELDASSSKEASEQDKAGRDFAISLSGKIHVEGGTNGQPMSISFDTSPEIPSRNETAHTNLNETSKLDNATKNDGETAPSTNFLSSLFNIASVPKDLTHHSQEENKNSSVNSPSIRQSVRDADEERWRTSRENHCQTLPRLSKKHSKIRKSRAVYEEVPERISKYRDDRSYDVGDSHVSEDVAYGSEFEDYQESLNNDDYSDLAAYDEAPVISAERRSTNSKKSCPESNRVSAVEHHSPEVKVIKIIPLHAAKSSASLSSKDSTHEDTKSSRMTASQLPKMEDDYVPGTTVKPGKIRPETSRWQENEDEDNPMLDSIERDEFPLKSSGSCSSHSESSEENSESMDADAFKDRRISTNSPVNLRVIGLVSVNQPSPNSPGSANLNSDANYEIVPLVHVKIEQQSENHEDVPVRPTDGGCPGIGMVQDFRGDESPCSRLHAEGLDAQIEDSTRRPEVATLNMDNDEELREPIQAGSCPGSNKKDSEILPDHSTDDNPNRISQTEAPSPCAGSRETPTTIIPRERLGGEKNRLHSRKKIRLKNMLAIMEFMKKIKELMSGEEAPELSNRNNKDIVVKLERVVVLPNNRSNESPTNVGPERPENRVVMMGEGVRHKPSENGIYFEKNFRLPGIDGGNNDGNASPISEEKINETVAGNKTFKTGEEDRDKSFLFYGENDKLVGANRSEIEDLKHDELSSTERTNDNTEDRQNQEESSAELHGHNVRLIERLKNAQNVVSDENNLRSESDGETSSNPEESKSSSRTALQNIERKINDRYRSLKNQERLENEEEDASNNVATKKRKSAGERWVSLIPKMKRHRSAMRFRSDRLRNEVRNERDAERQIYRRRSLPTSREVSRFGGGKFARYAASKGIPKEKRAKKKKKKKKRRRKKKKKKKKKGKSHREATVKGKAWWPFGRQLMSVSEERGLILDSNFDRSQVERVETKRHRGSRVPLPFEARGRRRVHRAKYPHEKRKKKRRKHKKGKKRKKKKKSRGKDTKKTGLRSKRQIKPGGTQVRGGQDCMDRRHPPGVNPAKYLESAHCLRYSDMWYSVYELESPIMEHTVYLQLFEKHSLEDGTTHWDDLTQGTMVRMGTFTRHQRDSKPTIVFTYSGAKTESQRRALNLDPAKQRLLVPSPVSPKKSSQYPEAKGGLGEYLVVQTNAISKDGNECDKAGVGFAAFSKQEDRCGRAKGSCLRNQPLAYWRHDTEAREAGRPGCYFLSNFASVPTNPIKYNVSGSGNREYLGLEYHSAHVSAIDIEVRTDYNAIVRVGSSGRVTEVYVDSTALEHTVVTVVISNMGLASSPYQPRITDCPTGLPVSWSKAKGIMQVIPPQHDQRVTLDLYGQLLINGFHCSVEVVNHRGELVAMRRIRVQKMDRCFCVWHCLCACIGSVSGMGCQPMSPEHYHAAGFQGPVPVVTTEKSILMNAVKDVLMLSALLVLLLLLLGILKWFVGMFVPSVGRWGLDSLLDGSKIEKYLEPELECRCVVTDEDGAPVHPDTGQRTVRICSRKLEFVLNLIFFLTYPVAICCGYFKRSLNASKQRNCCPDESKMCLINEKGSCPKMICVSTYGDSRNSRLEAEDTRYVMNELKKSQESLENPKRTKKKDSHRNGSGKNLSKKSSRKNKSASNVSAKRFVDDLLKQRMVFRNLTEPIGGLSVPAGTAYSLRGYFLNAEDGGYRFITPCPFKQHWLIDNSEKKASKPPETYPSHHFMRSFSTARDVYESNELSLTPQGVCINVQYLEDK